MRFIQLNKIDYHTYAEGQDLEPEVRTVVVTVNTESIRCFYPRKGGRPGSRITFTDRGGFAVAETPDQISGLLHELDSIISPALPLTVVLPPVLLPTPEGETVN
jgi:hypothetical protein